jgi:hypothetical protein
MSVKDFLDGLDVVRRVAASRHPRPVVAPEWVFVDCAHGLTFDAEAAARLPASEVRARWPRLSGRCGRCGFTGIAYVSTAHMIAGDW